MSKPVVLGNTAREVMDAWAEKIVSGKAFPDHIVGRLDTGGGLIEREFIFEVYEKVPLFAVMQNGKNIRSASSDEYTEVENAIAAGRFQRSCFSGGFPRLDAHARAILRSQPEWSDCEGIKCSWRR